MSHIVPELISIEDIENEQLLVTAYDNTTIRMNIFPRPPGSRKSDDDSPYRYTANCAPISKYDQEAENGIVHVIDRVLMPVTKTLMELVRERSDMAVLQTVLDKTDLAKQLENKEKQFTLFAPTDKAFEKLDPNVRRTIKEGKGCALSECFYFGVLNETKRFFHFLGRKTNNFFYFNCRYFEESHFGHDILFGCCC